MRNEKILKEMLDSQNICFLASVNSAGFPVIRAMLKPIKLDAGTCYLHTNTSSNKIQHFINNNKACLYFCNELNFRGITLLGNMDVLTREEDKRAFWKADYAMYYSNGAGMSDFTVLKFNIVSGQYYHDFMLEEV